MEEQKYWFPAKRYGWGWGLPVTWQGWVAVVVHLLLVVGGIPLIHPQSNPDVYSAYVGACTAALIGVCWYKGEPPRWRWGKE